MDYFVFIVPTIAVMLLMGALWVIELKYDNASFIDVGWVMGIGLTTVFLAVVSDGWLMRKLILMMMVLCWAIRLGLHLIKRISADPHEDKRYASLRREWGKDAHRNYFFLFQFQALLAIALAAGLWPALNDDNATWVIAQTLGIVVWIIGFAGESIADYQLKIFKANPNNKGKTCAIGLWNYSRHPNYFFEWVMWIGYAIYVYPSGWTGIMSAGLMLIFLVKLTGIPFSEQMALQTRGEDYRRYQSQTSIFIPWFKTTSSTK